MDESTALAAAPVAVRTVEELMPRVAQQPHRRDTRGGAAEPARTAAGREFYADVVEQLFAVYEHRDTLSRIVAVTARACADLQGQAARQAQPELLERLARARLDALEPDRAVSGPGQRR